jgi:hypothetical protein
MPWSGPPANEEEVIMAGTLEKQRTIYASPSDVLGEVAKWAIRQSPYPYPDNLVVVLEKLREKIAPDFTELVGWKSFATGREIEAYLEPILLGIPEFAEWNNRKNGRDGPGFVTRYDGARNPDDDFIDLHALMRNVSLSLSREADALAAVGT